MGFVGAESCNYSVLDIGEIRRKRGTGEFGLIRKQHAEVVEDVLRALDELRALLNEAIRPERAGLVGGLPPQAQAPVLAAARSLLDDGAWTKLCRALGQPSVPGLVEA